MPFPRKLRCVCFDWDGTLLDSAEASYRAYERVFGGFGLDFDRAEYARTYSPDWLRTYQAVGLPRERWPEADRLWVAAFQEQQARLLQGALELLARLAGAGLALGLVTSGEGHRVRAELLELGVAGHFHTVVCAEDVEQRKPHPDGLLRALRALQQPPEAAAYVGDSPEDVGMARAAAVFSIGIAGGFPNAEALRAARPDAWAGSLPELESLLLQA